MVSRRQDPVSDLLRSTLRLRQKATLAKERWQRILAAATAITPRYTTMPGAQKVDQRKDALWLAEAQAADEMKAADQAYWEAEAKVHALLSKLHDPAHAALLQYRYVYGLKWPEVLERLEQKGLYYSERHMYNLHGDALQEARRIYKEQEAQVDEDSDRTNTDQ